MIHIVVNPLCIVSIFVVQGVLTLHYMYLIDKHLSSAC